jgi:hypothetical protein
MNVRRYPMPGARELRTVRREGRIFVSVYQLGGLCSSGPLAIREDDLDTLRSALADLGVEAAAVEATENGGALR